MMTHISDLPDEILISIFKIYLKTESQKKFLTSIADVCEEWRRLCFSKIFWRKYDGTPSENMFIRLCKEGHLLHTEEMKFGRNNLPYPPLTLKEHFGSGFSFPKLKSITFEDTEKLNGDNLICFGHSSHNIKKFKLRTSIPTKWYDITVGHLGSFIYLQGHNLTTIDLSGSIIDELDRIINLFSRKCPNLKRLLLKNLSDTDSAKSFPIDTFQKGCTKLVELRLELHIIFVKLNEDDLPGFPALETFTHPTVHRFQYALFIDILSKSPNLKTLDVRGCKDIRVVDAVMSLPAISLENIYISMAEDYSSDKTLKILLKWSQSLRMIEICNMKSHIPLECGIKRMKLYSFTDTITSSKTVIKIIESCKNLDALTLYFDDFCFNECIETCQCSTIPLTFRGKNAIQNLYQSVINSQ